MKLTSTTLEQLRVLALRLFGLGAVCIFVPMLLLVLDREFPVALRIVLLVVLVIGVLCVGIGLGAYIAADKWNKLRRQGWKPLDIDVVLDEAAGETEKTLLDTADGSWRIAMARYPLAIRDLLSADNRVEYVGELEHDKPVLVRPVVLAGRSYEAFGYAKSLAQLKQDR